MTERSGMSRRQLLTCGGLAAAVPLVPAVRPAKQASPMSSPVAFQAYHGVSAAQHQVFFNQLSAEGYGMISLSVYGDPGNALYAAVWVNRPMPRWVAVHNVDAAGYQNWFNTWAAQGYASELVSATGSGNAAIFAAVMIQGVTGAWTARHNLSAADFAAQNSAAQAANMIPVCVSIYGDPGNPAYAGIWRANPGFTKWLVNPADPAPSYQARFDTDTKLPGYTLNGWRPAYVAVSSDQTYCSVYTDDSVGPWAARHGLSASQYQAEFNAQVAAGRYPIFVQGGGSGNNIVYTAVFAAQDQPMARQWTVTGAAVPAQAGIDSAMETFMKANGVRAAQVAFGQNGTIEFARAYTWAEPGYRVTQPGDLFLLASCSKMFCEAVIQALFDAKTLRPTDKAYAKLGFSHPADPRSDQITIQQLLDHTGGYDDTIPPNFDPTYNMGQIAQSMGVSRLDPARRVQVHVRPALAACPGTTYAYSNYGYLLLAAVADAVTPQRDYYSYLQAQLLQPEGITEVGIISTLASGRTGQEAIAEDPGLGMNALDPDLTPSGPQRVRR